MSYPRVRIPGPIPYPSSASGSGVVEHSWDRLVVRDLVRIVFFVPHDHFDIAAGGSHAWGFLRRQGRERDEEELRRWWRRFID